VARLAGAAGGGTRAGLSQALVEQEQLVAERTRRWADADRVNALLRDPAYVHALQAQTALRPMREDGTFAPLPVFQTPEPESPRDPNAPPSAGRSISPPRRRW